MTTLLNTCPEAMALEPIGADLYRGLSLVGGPPRTYGGQIVSQALSAANATVENWLCHSIHCYYIRGGDPAHPFEFQVTRTRDGGSFATRQVTARQDGVIVFDMLASFQAPETGFEHQDPIPVAPAPDDLMTRSSGPSKVLDLRIVPERRRPDGAGEPQYQAWIRAGWTIGDDPRLHQAALAYASDMTVMTAAMRPHGVTWQSPGLQAASLDHSVWFHSTPDFNRWHLFTLDSSWGGAGRGLVRGSFYREDGLLVASLAQEGIMRRRAPR